MYNAELIAAKHLFRLTVDQQFLSSKEEEEDYETLLHLILHREEALSLWEELQVSEAAMDSAFLPC